MRSTTAARIWAYDGGGRAERDDRLAAEEPLEIRLVGGGVRRTIAVTMRTPGADFELVAGFLHSEGVVAEAGDIARMSYCLEDEQTYNVVTAELRAGAAPDLAPLERHIFTSSACGVCGKASLEALRANGLTAVAPGPHLDGSVLLELPGKLRAAQGVFEATGGLHAAGLFEPGGELLAVREDVGRHNAVDKLIGFALLERRLPLREAVVVVSGRASYEIAQKCLAAGVPALCAVSAPSSLAVDLAREFGMTLVGFLREGRFNVYAGVDRIA